MPGPETNPQARPPEGGAAFFTHPAAEAHETPAGHPECAERIRAVARALSAPAFDALIRRQAPLAPRAALEAAHSAAYVAAIEAAAPESGLVFLDADTAMGPHSLEAAKRAAGAAVAAVDGVARGEFRNAFCAMRPPGHHAEPDRAMGFCLFNTVVAAALHARHAHGHERVAVVDFDVHHGNGTQAAFWRDEAAFFGSTHQAPPHYPGTGHVHETGEGGVIVNAPLAPGTGGREFRAAMESRILPALDDFGPDFILISAGFDAHAADPLGALNLHERDFAWATAEICRVARQTCGGRVVSTLEGGYDVDALAASAAAHVAALMAA